MTIDTNAGMTWTKSTNQQLLHSQGPVERKYEFPGPTVLQNCSSRQTLLMTRHSQREFVLKPFNAVRLHSYMGFPLY